MSIDELFGTSESYLSKYNYQDVVIEGDTLLMFVGDAHFQYTTPISRIDDFPQTTLDKLGILRRECVDKKVKVVIFSGDFFDKINQPPHFLNRLFNELLAFKSLGIELYTIVGNHDIVYDRIDTLDRSALSLAFIAGVIKPLKTLTIKTGEFTYRVKGFNYGEPIVEAEDKTLFNIAVAHCFYESGLDKDSLDKDKINDLGYKVYLLGHDHVPYKNKTEVTSVGETLILRPGSFTRGTSHSYNTERGIFVDLLACTAVKGFMFTRLELQVKKPNEIFSEATLNRIKDGDILPDLGNEFSNLVTSLYRSRDYRKSVYDYVDSVENMDAKVLAMIEKYLTSVGIYRLNKQEEVSNANE